MFFDYNEDQEEFRSVLKQLLTQYAGSERVRTIAEQGTIDRELWRTLCVEMGAAALHLAEDLGGSGFSLIETAILAQELGRNLAPVPLIATAIVTEALIQHGGAQAEELIAPLLMAEQIATAPFRCLTEVAEAVTVDDRGRVSGSLGFVPHARDADLVLAAATDLTGAVRLALVPLGAEGVTVESAQSLDLTRAGAYVQLTEASAVFVTADALAEADLERIDAVGRTLLAAEMVGSAREALQITVDYAKIRKQFNREIGSFQAVKHLCAESSIAIEVAHPVADFAASTHGTDSFVLNSIFAKYEASEALSLTTSNGIQVHGGMGFTWEASPHLYFRRAWALSGAYGDANAVLVDVYQRTAADALSAAG